MRKHRILVVEDEAIIGMHIKSTLGQFGYDVLGVAVSAKEAVAMSRELEPDLILMDIVMPGNMDGIDAAGLIRSTLDLPVVYLTGNADVSTVARARETNPYGYVLKPVNPQDLFSTIDTALNRHELGKKLRENEEKLRKLTDNMRDMVGQIDGTGRIVYASPSHKKIAGYDPGELIGTEPLDLVHADDREALRKAFYRGVADHEDILTEYRGRHRDGHYIWLETVHSFMYTPEGTFDGAVFSSRDITARKRIEALHRESEERYNALFSRSHDCVYVHDFTGKFIDANEAALQLFGYSKEEVKNLDFQSILSEDQLPVALEALKEVFISGVQKDKREYRVRTKKNEIKNIEVVGMMLYRDGKPDAILGIARDITERRLIEKALIASEEKYRALVESTDTGYVIVDSGGCVMDANPEYVRLTGHADIGEILGRSVIEWTAVHHRIKNKEAVRRCFEQGFIRGLEIDYVDSRENITPIEINATVAGSGPDIRIHTLCRDISRRRVTEDELLKSKERYRSLFDNANDIVLTVDLDLKFTSFNRKTLELTGYTPEEAMQLRVPDIVLPEYMDIVNSMMQKKIESGDATRYEVEIRSKSGERISLEINTQLIYKDGKPVGVQGIARDISERKQMEARIQAALAEKETLLREVHHRVKNNFQVIMSLMALQADDIQSRELRKSFIDMQSRIRSMALIHEKLYQSDDLSRVDFASYTDTIVRELCGSLMGENARIKPRVEAAGIRLSVDQAIPCGLIINELVTNSIRHAFPAGWKGEPQVLVSIRESGGTAEMIISDNGIGLPDPVDPGKKKSLGLSLVPMLVMQLGGTIVLERSPGTRATITFSVK